VANNLNDIAKDNPDITLDISKKWYGTKHPHSVWIAKHGCRTLLKQSEPRALELFGFKPLTISNPSLTIENENLTIGDDLRFSFNAHCERKNSKLRLEYAIDYVKKNGKRNRKVFQISEKDELPSTIDFTRKQSLKEMSTRKHHPGTHNLAIIINGNDVMHKEFTLSN
jgi:hypothetical protein